MDLAYSFDGTQTVIYEYMSFLCADALFYASHIFTNSICYSQK